MNATYILMATNNLHKIEEIQEICTKLIRTKLTLIAPQSINIDIKPNENGTTFEENAIIKAMDFYRASNMPVIADDSGLVIPELDYQPGIHSARFANPTKEQNNNTDIDAQNRAKVLRLMQNIENRQAEFICTIAYHNGSNDNKTNPITTFKGTLKGYIAHEEKGNNGFGYDSIFIPNTGNNDQQLNLTLAQMKAEDKNKISHRFAAIKLLCEYINNNI